MLRKKKKEVKNSNTITLDELVSKLTLEEKISLVSGKDFWRTVNIDRLHIPSVMLSDGPHGLRKQTDGGDHLGVSNSVTAVCFPPACALASSFDRKLVSGVGRLIGEEAQAEDIAVVLGPAVNIKRSPLGGRNFEYFSEDPYLTGELASAYIDGVQSTGTGTSLKHFAVNNQEKRRLTVSAETDERTLREIYLRGFEKAVKKSSPATVMCSYNRVNGVQVSENKYLLTDILRDEWGYKGVVVSDWGAVNDRSRGLKAGLDLEMPTSSGIGARNIRGALERGELEESDLDIACRRILNLAFKWKQNRQSFEFDREYHHEKAKEAALGTAVLLKNDGGVLPLNDRQNVAIIGEFAQNPRYQGGGSSHIRSYKVSGILDCLKDNPRIKYCRGFETGKKDNLLLISQAVTIAADSDAAVIFAGLPDEYESEGFDRRHLRLPDEQNALISAVAAVQKNTVVVLHNGSAVEMPWIDNVPAVLECYLGGEAVGEAQADLLFGKVSPSGKLAETFPLRLSDTPCYEYFPGTADTSEYREGIFVGYRYYQTFAKPTLFPFGHGLSYTQFRYSDLKVDNKNIFESHGASVSVTVTNVGSRPGAEVVQLYISALNPSVFRSKLELRGFEKVYLEPGESRAVTMRLEPEDFAYYNINEKAFVCENGNYDILIGSSSEDIRLRDRFILSGFKNCDNPYSADVNAMYSSKRVNSLSRSDFEKLLGRKVDVDIPSLPLTVENSIGDALGTPHADRIFSIITLVSRLLGDVSNAQMLVCGAMEMPIRSLCAMSGGAVNEKMGEAIVDYLNGGSFAKLIAGLAAGKLKPEKSEKHEKH